MRFKKSYKKQPFFRWIGYQVNSEEFLLIHYLILVFYLILKGFTCNLTIFQIHNGHKYMMANFSIATFCEFCNSFIWDRGFVCQGKINKYILSWNSYSSHLPSLLILSRQILPFSCFWTFLFFFLHSSVVLHFKTINSVNKIVTIKFLILLKSGCFRLQVHMSQEMFSEIFKTVSREISWWRTS